MSEGSYFFWFSCYLAVFAGLSAFGAHRLKMLWYYWKHRGTAQKSVGQYEKLPIVTVQLPIFNELHVVERLLEAVAALDYPADRLEIQVLDDSTDETAVETAGLVEMWRGRGVDMTYIHRKNRVGFKAGALDEGLKVARGEFVCIFDADFVPQKDYLQLLIHHFTDPKVGMVQARWGHLNRDSSLLTRLQALFLDGHLVLEQSARSREGFFLNFNGTAGIWRRCVIDEAGGWQHDTLTEDLDLSYRAQMLGWRFVYLEDVVVPAELPPDMNSFKSQQHRWTKGSIQVCKKLLGEVWMSDVGLKRKLEATIHLTSNFAYLLTIGVLVLMYPANFLFESSWEKLFLVDLPVFFFAAASVVLFYLAAQGAQRDRSWVRAVPYLPALLALGVGMSINNGRAVIEALLGQESEFVRTPKYGEGGALAVGTHSPYKAGKSVVIWIEGALTLYFAVLVAMALSRGQWGSLPFMMLFLGGFGYVFLSSVMAGRR
jgi:cellulose synthase/poly-beta-1,6-N-acetylglucosamine synthase-like glycosyltransferase